MSTGATVSGGFVGFDPVEVQKLVVQLRGAAEDLNNMANQAKGSLDRAVALIPVNTIEYDIGQLRGCAATIGEMSADVQRRLDKFLQEQQLKEAAEWGERALGGASEALERELERLVPGRWVGGDWIPGHWVVEERVATRPGPGFALLDREMVPREVPGRLGPKTWIKPQAVHDVPLQKAGKWLGRGMNVLDVGLAGWGEWGRRKDLSGAERLLHAGLAGATEGIASAGGGYLGYGAGFAAAIALGASPVGAVVVVAGIGGAIVGSEVGKVAGRAVKEFGKGIGRGVAGGAKKVVGWFK